ERPRSTTQSTSQRAGRANPTPPGMTRREWKEEKWKRKVETAKRREQNVEQHILELQRQHKGSPATRPVVANPQQLAQDFDWGVNWEQKNNRGVYPEMDYGYSAANHLSPAGCAPGEIGGSVSGAGLS